MKLSTKGMALAAGLLWAGSLLVCGLANLWWPPYARAYLDLAASIYPGYHGPAGFGSVLVVTLYGFVDAAVGGALLAWLYNLASGTASGGGRP
jgi:hypothetical protein